MLINRKVAFHSGKLEERTYLGFRRLVRVILYVLLKKTVLLSGRESGLMSPSRTMHCGCKRSTKAKKRERLMRPTGRRRARMRAGAMGDRGSTAIATLGKRDQCGRESSFSDSMWLR